MGGRRGHHGFSRSITYEYDNLDRAMMITQTVAGLTPEIKLVQTYDVASNRNYATIYLGGVWNTSNVFYAYYDNLNRLRRVYHSGPTGAVAMKQVFFSYDGLDRFTSIQRYEYHDGPGWKKAMDDVYAYDKAGRMTELRYWKGGGNFVRYTWTYDRASRPTQFTSQTDGTVDYTYDATSQLTGADYNYQTDESYSYDANGNRTNTGYDTDPNNRLASDGVYNYEYDNEGNRIRRTKISDGTVTEYTWDHRNRLTNVTELDELGGNATKVVDYTYDVNNRLVGKILDPDGEGEEGTSEEYYVYDGDQILLRFDGPNTADLVDRYLWAPAVDLLLSDEKLTAPDEPGDIYWTLGDNLNTVRDIARYNSGNDTTTIVNHRVYDAYGNLTTETNSAVDLIFSFTGRLFDEATNLQNDLNRWYDPAVGRWLSEDPIGFTAGDANLNRYVGNDPAGNVDPSGLMAYRGSARPTRPRAPQGSLRSRAFSSINNWTVNSGWLIVDVPGSFIVNLFGNAAAKPAVWLGTYWRDDTREDRINAILARQRVINQSREMGTGTALVNLYASATTDPITFGAVGYDPIQDRRLGTSERIQRVAGGTAAYASTWTPVAQMARPRSVPVAPSAAAWEATPGQVGRFSRTSTPWGRNVWQRPDIDWSLRRPDGLTNLEAVQRGYSPLRQLGDAFEEVQLHHLNQNPSGSLVEVWRSTHQNVPHNVPPPSWRVTDPAAAAAFRREVPAYWHWRGGQVGGP